MNRNKRFQEKNILYLIIRYAILLVVAFPNLTLFYYILTPLTLHVSYFIINLLIHSELTGNLIINDFGVIELIDACIAGSAYYLLLVLNLSTPNINFKKRVLSIAFSFLFFFLANILRISILSLLFFEGYEFFNTVHLWTWYAGSTLLVFGIWILEIKFFKIKDIPVYSDIKNITRKIRKTH